MKKNFENPIKSIGNYEKETLGTSDSWSTSCLSHRPSKPAYYNVDGGILGACPSFLLSFAYTFKNMFLVECGWNHRIQR